MSAREAPWTDIGNPSRKSDAAVAAVVAFERAMWHAQNPQDVPFVEVIGG